MPAGYSYNYPVSRGFSLACVYEVVRVACWSRKAMQERNLYSQANPLSNKMCSYAQFWRLMLFFYKNTWSWAPENYLIFLNCNAKICCAFLWTKTQQLFFCSFMLFFFCLLNMKDVRKSDPRKSRPRKSNQRQRM